MVSVSSFKEGLSKLWPQPYPHIRQSNSVNELSKLYYLQTVSIIIINPAHDPVFSIAIYVSIMLVATLVRRACKYIEI